MNQPLQDLSNAREEMQRQIMEELAQTGECFLCEDVIRRIAAKYAGVATLPFREGDHWFVKHNDFPYEGAKLHLLIVPRKHVTKVEDLSPEQFLEFREHLSWANNNFNIRGASVFMRYGDMAYTGATLAHLHFHVLHGVAKYDGSESIRAKLGYK